MATQAAVRGAQPQGGAAPKVKILRIGIIQGGTYLLTENGLEMLVGGGDVALEVV